ncbi:LuxR family transcriptional regulator [Paractinoplanes abujensis]|uniref:Non-specific serine/threonine protein kinase n=1 Tax=Paractinoplanes abujensis TaxID=882441 RepID=A0A7W7CNP0_9ACTN|nr:LuxR C-terminal-related transcriptional regulator [Actinoplanes abujensis]MBB4691905.1 non-specific serine/threonine protein kinase [Actinoplanes abujensis]GID16674.1 LuxR family transcriptional regulator [Actinoplanes abujensis]
MDARTAQSRRLRGNLPAELSSFVGRHRERAELKRLLSTSRMVTITGIGGVGKTRTAIRVAAEVQRAFPDGVWLVDLSAIADPCLIAEAVGQALGVQDQSARPQEDGLAGYLASRRLLLVLDTCEHVVGACSALVETLLRAAPGMQVLATSRQPIGVDGEHVFLLPPLPVPDPAASPADREVDAAVMLFAERAAAAAPGFALTEANQDAVARLCRRLDGIPLGIELAAVRTRALPVERIAELVEGWYADESGLLSRAGGGRHESLRKAVDGSYELCTAGERMVWARASVFADGFDLEAVHEVCGDKLDLVAGLVDKSVLVLDGSGPAGRYRMLDTLREYGAEILRASGEEHAVRQRHRDHYLRLARRFDAEWCGPRQAAWFRRLTLEHPNLRAALDFCLSDPGEHHAGLELAASLTYFWFACGHPREGRHYLERAMALAPEPGPARTHALWACAWICAMQGDQVKVAEYVEECRPYADVVAQGWSTFLVGVSAALRGEPSMGVACLQESVRLHGDGGDPGLGRLMAMSAQAIALAFLGEYDQAAAVTEQHFAICDRTGEQWARSYAEYVRSVVELNRDRPEAAVVHARAALRIKRQVSDLGGNAMAMDSLACAAAVLGDPERAARLFGIAHRHWESVGLPQMGSPDLSASRVWAEKQARDVLGDQRFEVLLTEGLGFDFEAGVAYALEEQPAPAAASPTDWAPLTRREREVAELVAAGKTNQQIADRLVISRRTANTHLEHILTKLDFNARAQIAAWVAARRG